MKRSAELAVAAFLSLVLMASCEMAKAGEWEVVSEIAMGWKTNVGTDAVFDPDCIRIGVLTPRDFRGGGPLPHVYRDDCGGHPLVYAGYPIAFIKDQGNYSWKIGWFHFSSWGDGRNTILGSFEDGENGEVELSFNCICGSFQWNWSRWRAGR